MAEETTMAMLAYITAATRRLNETLRGPGRRFATMLLLSLLLIWMLFAGIVCESYLNACASTGAFVGNVQALVSLNVARTIELYDLSVKAAAEGFSDPAVMSLPTAMQKKALFDRSANASGLGALAIFDRNGLLVADSRAEQTESYSAADRDYFNVHAGKAPPVGLYISHPFKAHGHDGSWTIALSRRLEKPDGSFAGVVVGTLKLGYFVRLFGTVRLPDASVMTLVHEDGTVLMRSRLVDIGRDLTHSELYREMVQRQSGEISRVSTIDGVERLYHFGYVDHLPIMLIVGLPTSDFLATWRWRMVFVALGFATLSIFIILLAVALGRELHRRALAEAALLALAVTDGMTDLANRRHFDQLLQAEWARAGREGRSMALLMVDNDFFKSYNDTYGHLRGDEALKAVAAALRDTVRRPADLVARFGGEEFAILLPGTDLDGALQVGEAVREAVAQLAWAHPRSPFGHLTVSIGVAACLPVVDRDPHSLIEAADFALYEAKERGRNQVATGERLDLTGFGWRASG